MFPFDDIITNTVREANFEQCDTKLPSSGDNFEHVRVTLNIAVRGRWLAKTSTILYVIEELLTICSVEFL